MTKGDLFLWSIWIGVLGGLYCLIYSSLPIFAVGLMWMTFVSLPIYFNAGAKRDEFFNYVASMLIGVAWGWLFLYCIGVLANAGMALPLNFLIVIGGLTIAVCAVHFCLTDKTWFNKVPMMFGAISMTFSQNGKNLTTIMITLFGGIFLGWLMGEGVTVINKYKKSPEAH